MKILVIGAGGFIGSHLVEQLAQSDHEVTALCKYNSSGSYGWLDFLNSRQSKKIEVVLGDVTDTEQMYSLVARHELTINMSALIGIPYSFIAPRSYVNVNILGTLNLLEATRKLNSRIVQISTSEVYGTPSSVPIGLEHPINPQSPYAASKAAADYLAKSYAMSFGTKVLVLRPFNTYGPRQSMRAIIPTILNQLINDSGVIRLGRTDVRRDFTFVTDTVSAITKSVESDLFDGRTIQLGTGISHSIEDILDMCREIFDVSFTVMIDNARIRPGSSEVEVLESDASSAIQDLGWKYQVDLREGLMTTFEWMKGQKNNPDSSSRYFI